MVCPVCLRCNVSYGMVSPFLEGGGDLSAAVMLMRAKGRLELMRKGSVVALGVQGLNRLTV